jgi:hypothetical protein
VELEKARGELPSVATRTEAAGGVGGAPQEAGGSTIPKSTAPRAEHTFPTSVESPSQCCAPPISTLEKSVNSPAPDKTTPQKGNHPN